MRPKEIRVIKLKDIDLKKGQIRITKEISKNSNVAFVTIPKPFQKELRSLKILEKYDPDYYLISKEGSGLPTIAPGKTMLSINIMSKRHRDVLKLLNFKDDNYTYYSWKHTGVVAAYNAGVKIKSIQFQCRHYSLEMTDKYLKSLGLKENDEMLNLMPEM